MYKESLAAYEKVVNLRGDSTYSRTLRGLILAIAGKTDEAKTILNEMRWHPKLDHIALVYLAETYSVLGEKDEAFEFLEASYKERVSLLTFLRNRPAVRQHPLRPALRRPTATDGVAAVAIPDIPILKEAKAEYAKLQ